MSVTVNIPQFWQHLAEDEKMAEVEGSTVRECLDKVVKKYPSLNQVFFDDEGNLASLLNVWVNKKSAFPEQLEKQVESGDEIHIAYTLVGG